MGFSRDPAHSAARAGGQAAGGRGASRAVREEFDDMRKIEIAAVAAVAMAAAMLAGGAGAQTIAALAGGDTLIHIDAAAKKVTKTVKIKGVGKLAGIDMRPADGMLYGLAVDGTVVTIDPATGMATQKSKLKTMLAADVGATVDFNPVADRLRILGTDGTSLRANVDTGDVIVDGSLKYADGDANAGKKPNVVAGAYINSVKGAKATVLYDIDGTVRALLRQNPPNDGVLGTIGPVRVKGRYAFDIQSPEEGKNTAWLLASGTLFTVDLATGLGKTVGKIAGLERRVTDIAILP
jgi:hypothetical protein